MRTLPLVSLGFVALSAAACYEHHTADEQVVEPSSPADAGVDGVVTRDAATGARDAGSDCSKLTGLEALTCSLGGGGAGDLGGILDAILGGGASGATNCSKQPDPTAQLLCTLAGGTGLEGIINGLLGGGGGLLGGGDAGVNGLVQGAITEVLRGVIDDLIGSLFPQPNRDAGGLLGGGGFLGGTRADAGGVLGGLFGGGQLGRDAGTTRRDAGAGNKALSLQDDGFRTAEECASPDPEDRLTRLLCLRQKLDEIEALSGPGAAP